MPSKDNLVSPGFNVFFFVYASFILSSVMTRIRLPWKDPHSKLTKPERLWRLSHVNWYGYKYIKRFVGTDKIRNL